MLQDNLIKMYQESFRAHRELPALTDFFKHETFSYYEMAKEIAKLHILFDELKVKRGDKIALIGRNNPRWVMSYIATVTYGAVIVPILQDFNPNDINHIITHSESRFLFLSDHLWDVINENEQKLLEAAFSLTDYACIWEKKGDDISKFQKSIVRHYRDKYPKGFHTEDIVYPEIPNDSLALISYTSGTTGFSKGVMLNINALTTQVAFCLPKRRHWAGSRVLAFLPLAHTYGCAIDMLSPLAAGSHITLLGKIPSPKILLEALSDVRPNVICSVPMVLEKVVKKQVLPKLNKGFLKFAKKMPLLSTAVYRTIHKQLVKAFGGEFIEVVIGGAPLNAEVEEFLLRIKFPVVVGYGMTETAPLISYCGHDEGYKRNSAGRLIRPYLDMKIDSSDPVNIAGEILVKGESVMLGYYKNEEATREMFDEDGWLRTGDIGTIDEDDIVFIRGRSKTTILSASGQNIYPEEIEAKLNNLHCVMESLVVERDDKLVALVVPDYEQTDASNISPTKLEQIMNDNLVILNSQVASYEQISKIILYPTEFEKTPKKSIKRFLYTV